MSQTALGSALRITFQQVQKYEKGANRIGASRLSQISTMLQVPVEWFFQDLPKARASGPPAAPDYTRDFLATADGMALAKAFLGIKSKDARRRLARPRTPIGRSRSTFSTRSPMPGFYTPKASMMMRSRQ